MPRSAIQMDCSVAMEHYTLQHYSTTINELVWPGDSSDVPDDYAEGDRARPILR